MKDIIKRAGKFRREEEFKLYGRSIFFRSTITKNKKKYSRKLKHKKNYE